MNDRLGRDILPGGAAVKLDISGLRAGRSADPTDERLYLPDECGNGAGYIFSKTR